MTLNEPKGYRYSMNVRPSTRGRDTQAAIGVMKSHRSATPHRRTALTKKIQPGEASPKNIANVAPVKKK
jgi:hypothetical protein